MSRARLFLVFALVVLTLASAAITQAAGPITVPLAADNDSGETGTATFTDLGNGKTMVEVSITGAPEGVAQPMHIHDGQCGPTLGKVAFPLTSLEGGKSSTTIDADLASLQTGNFALNGHKSAAEVSVYVFCGNIPAAAATLPATGGDFTNGIVMIAILGALALVTGFVLLRKSPRAQ